MIRHDEPFLSAQEPEGRLSATPSGSQQRELTGQGQFGDRPLGKWGSITLRTRLLFKAAGASDATKGRFDVIAWD